jgi:nucleotide-binding universal stress UspA family protein
MPNPKPQTILVPVDYGEPSRVALKQAISLARVFGSKLVLIFAWAAPYATRPLSSEHLTSEQQSLFDLVRKECEDTMIGFIREVQSDAEGLDLAWFVFSGDPGRVILEQAEGRAADLIIMGSHGRDGAARWFLGSVAETVLRHATCPVMVIPGPREPH